MSKLAPRVVGTDSSDLSEAYSFLSPDHSGPCAMSYRGSLGVEWAIFESAREAEIAAAGAIRNDIGGYSDVEVHPENAAPPGTRRYESAVDWIGDDGSAEDEADPLSDPEYRHVFARNVGEIRAALDGLPDRMPVVHTGLYPNDDGENRQGLMVHSADWWHFRNMETNIEHQGGWTLRIAGLDSSTWEREVGRAPKGSRQHEVLGLMPVAGPLEQRDGNIEADKLRPLDTGEIDACAIQFVDMPQSGGLHEPPADEDEFGSSWGEAPAARSSGFTRGLFTGLLIGAGFALAITLWLR